ncbi:MAG: extracellular solute-binding protein [Planctomycetota bacterium]
MVHDGRRQFLAMAALGGVALAAGGTGYVLFATIGSTRIVCYTSMDEAFAVDLFKMFKRKFGLDVAVQYDAESEKTVGLANRLIQEKNDPQCDVFWNNEILQTVRLAEAGLFQPFQPKSGADLPPSMCDPQHRWHGYAARVRCLLVNNKLIPPGGAPRFFSDFTQPQWKGRLAIANPIGGTTASQVAALWTIWGETRFKQFVADMKANHVRVESGNADSAQAAAEGRAAAALTDTDDALVRIAKGFDCRIEFPGQSPDYPGRLLIPTTVALVKDAPHRAGGQRLVEAILDRSTEQALADGPAGQMPVRPGMRPPKGLEHFDPNNLLEVDWVAVSKNFEASQKFVIEAFN